MSTDNNRQDDFTPGDNRDDRGQGIGRFDLEAENLEEQLENIVIVENAELNNESNGNSNPSEQPAHKKSTIANAAKAAAVVSILLVGYLGYAVVQSMKADASKQQVVSSNVKNKSAQPKNNTEPSSTEKDLDSQINARAAELVAKQLASIQDENKRFQQLVIQRLEEMDQAIKSRPASTDQPTLDMNDVTTRLLASVIPEIKKYSDANANRLRKEMNAKLFDLKSSNTQTIAKAEQKVVPELPAHKKELSSHQTVQDAGYAKDLKFVMATTDLMLVTAVGDVTERIITLRPGEHLKNRGIIKSITPRGCIWFEDNTKYEVQSREGACSNEL